MSQQKEKYYQRFSITQRVEHWVMFASFTLLALTGIPQKFVGQAWAETMIAAFGGIEQTRIIHRWAAILLVTVSVAHILVITYRIFVRRGEMSMLPGLEDMTDLVGVLAYNLGFRKDRPRMPRFNYAEKMEYWAFVWGTALMAATGFMLWNPIATAKIMPGSFIPAAKAAHGGEALLAVLAIIVWHFYWVHLRHFNRSMFTGKLSHHEMEHEHAAELERIETGQKRPLPTGAGIARRTRIYVPVAVILMLLFLVGLYYFVTFEDTAPKEALAAAIAGETRNGFKPIELPAGAAVHSTLINYSDPTSCAASGCHTGFPLETATESTHNLRISAAGPNPWLAKLVEGDSGEVATPECLVCHAAKLQADDLLASAQTVRNAGGVTCTRCHTGHSGEDVHSQVGLACVGCHTSVNHEIQAEVNCTQCHAAQPHTNPLLNSKHQRLDCRTCHVQGDIAITVDAGQPVQNPETGFFDPTITVDSDEPRFEWYLDGKPAKKDDEGAMIVPVVPVTVQTPRNFDPVAFTQDGVVSGSTDATTSEFVPSHEIKRGEARTCATCHGPEGDFDFSGLGYGGEGLSIESTEE